MRLTGLTLPILLGALLLQVIIVETKQGVCPECLNPCSENVKMVCDSDEKCNGTQKCCQVGCVYSCKDPAVIKPGLCPRSPTPDTACPTVIPMKDRHCIGDQDCNGTQKCCKDGCGYSCKDPAEMKPGVCPPCPFPCLRNVKINCENDENCNGTQKCCQDGCVYSCKDPVVTKPGECPVSQTPCLGSPIGPVCLGDEDCDGAQKCCKDGSHFSCKDPVVIKPGVCPISVIHVSLCKDLKSMEDRYCNGDQDCNGTQKCCVINCEYYCIKPAVTKKGECPEPQMPATKCYPWMVLGSCESDKRCDGKQKCCNEGCWHECKDPVETPRRHKNSAEM